MTVETLIEELKQYDKTLKVTIATRDYEEDAWLSYNEDDECVCIEGISCKE